MLKSHVIIQDISSTVKDPIFSIKLRDNNIIYKLFDITAVKNLHNSLKHMLDMQRVKDRNINEQKLYKLEKKIYFLFKFLFFTFLQEDVRMKAL